MVGQAKGLRKGKQPASRLRSARVKSRSVLELALEDGGGDMLVALISQKRRRKSAS